jgi:fructokinase
MSGLFVGIGELLWDVFPAGRQLGGAPANFAYIASVLGNRAAIVSRVGDDDLGREAQSQYAQLGLDVSHIQVDPLHTTGTVEVRIDIHGQPGFEILDDAAWDRLEWTPSLQRLAGNADVVCFGSLAQRHEPSRSTIQRFLRASQENTLRIFDVNLRQQYYNPEILKTGFALATVVKMNDAELSLVMQSTGQTSQGDLYSDAELLLNHFDLELVCITRGAHGSLLINRSHASDHPGVRVPVADTVGAGDAFTAALAHGLRWGLSLDATNELANRVGAWVASQPGATPLISPEDLRRSVSAGTRRSV